MFRGKNYYPIFSENDIDLPLPLLRVAKRNNFTSKSNGSRTFLGGNKHLISKPPNDTGHFHSSNHQKWLTYQIIGDKTVKSVQIDPQTTEIWLKVLNVPSVSL